MSWQRRGRGIVLLSGGYGGARLAPALVRSLAPDQVTIVANVGDDLTLLGLRICPDLDSLTYALSGLWAIERGWGRAGETFNCAQALLELEAPTYFTLGDRDLALHLRRTELLRQGWTLTEVTAEVARALGLTGVTLLPASDEPSETRIVTADGRRLAFQEWYVRERAHPQVAAAQLAGGPVAPAVRAALGEAGTVILGPSNPVSSVGAILALQGMRDLLAEVPRRIAVSPVAASRPSQDDAATHHAGARATLLAARGLRDVPEDVATLYADLAEVFVIDAADQAAAPAVEAIGLEVVATDLLDAPTLARTLSALVQPSPTRWAPAQRR